MRKYLIILILNIFLANELNNFGSFIYNANSSESISMSDATVSWIKGASSMMSNPAGLTALAYSNKKFIKSFDLEIGSSMETANTNSIGDTQFPAISIAWGYKPNIQDLFFGFGVSYQSLQVLSVEHWSQNESFQGYFDYLESAFSAGIAVEYSPVKIGFKWIIYTQNIEIEEQIDNLDYLKTYNFLPSEFGLQYKVNNNIDLGLLISKSTKVGNHDMSLYRSKVGMSYKLNTKHFLALDWEKTSMDFSSLKFGYQYRVLDNLSIRSGLQSEVIQENDDWSLLNTMQGSFGFSFRIFKNIDTEKDLIFNISLKQHMYPNITNPLSRNIAFSISYKKFN